MRNFLMIALSVFALSSFSGCFFTDCDGSCGRHDYWEDDYSWDSSCYYDAWGYWVCDGYSTRPDAPSIPGSDDDTCVRCGNEIDDSINHPADDPIASVSCSRDADCGVDSLCNAEGACVPYECKVNSDCSNDDICAEGRCIPCQTNTCDTSREVECVFGSQCESGLCADGACIPAGKCVFDSNCQEGQVCLDGECLARPECLSDAECGEGRICNASHACEDDVECRVDADCGEGLICLQNMCAQCRLSCECPNEGDVCMNGMCVAR